MCHNHSHLAGFVLGRMGTDQFEVLTIETTQALSVESPTGTRLLLRPYTRLYVPLPVAEKRFSQDFLQTVGLIIASYAKGLSEFDSLLITPTSFETGSTG